MEKKWTSVIDSKHKFFDLKLKEVMKYKDLILLFVRSNFTSRYKQTILGPLWFIIQPLLTTLIHTVVFGSIAGFQNAMGAVPYFLFNMAGNIPWVFFSTCLNGNSSIFRGNASIYSKVYFPRLCSPIANAIVCMGDFLIQFGLLGVFMAYFMLTGAPVCPRWELLLLPVLLVQMALLGMGLGFLVSSVTTKYRDLSLLFTFGVSLLMYVSPIIYPSSVLVEGSTMHTVIMLNPISPVIEIFRTSVLGTGAGGFPWMYWGISWGVTLVIAFWGILVFNKTERNFLDTV